MTDMSNVEFIRDLAARMFRNATPAMGFGQGDTDRLYVIANRLSALEQAGEPVADFYYPIEMPLNADGHGPATVGEDATTMTFEVWDQFCDSHGRFARLSDAIQRARQLNALPTLQRLGQEFDAGEGHRLAHAWLDENFSDVPDADFSAADMERAFLAGLAQSRGQAFDGEGEA
ncbi:hypothetical protein [Sphingobium yanoikuyae]|jgi:hypothetical protein|uniref:hypothetical protein n=1 Tax=Sphingobium yanoikuyae TaxID=13690 RepID=UPI0028DBA10A|nr:hypothetical protein [Sphingobium yanoikuyae]